MRRFMNYYISDLHLFHKNVTRAGKGFDDRPFDNLEEMHSIIKEKWNAKVTKAIRYIFLEIWRCVEHRKN